MGGVRIRHGAGDVRERRARDVSAFVVGEPALGGVWAARSLAAKVHRRIQDPEAGIVEPCR